MYNNIGVIILTLTVFITFFLFQKRGKTSLEIKVLNWLFLLWSVRSLMSFFLNDFFVARALIFQNITLFESSTILIYIRLINKKKLFSFINLAIVSPVLLYFFYTIAYYFFNSEDELLQNYIQLRKYDELGFYGMSNEKIAFLLLRFSLFLYIILMSIVEFSRYQKVNKNQPSKNQYYWLIVFVVGCLIVYIVPDLLCRLIGISPVINKQFIATFYQISFLLFVLFVGLKGMNQVPVVNLNSGKLSSQKKYLKSRLQEKEVNEIFFRLEKDILRKKLYLNPELNLRDLARSQNVTTNVISQVINAKTKNNFYDFINKYRIIEVKKRLRASSKETILQIAYASGFNSKTTFNTSFKKETGITPSQYRSELKKS